MKASYLLILLLYLPLSCNSAQPGGGETKAGGDALTGVEAEAEDDGDALKRVDSKNQDGRDAREDADPGPGSDEPGSTAGEANGTGPEIPTVNPEWSVELDEQVRETSGLLLWDGALWTMNDDSDTRLYKLNTGSGEIISTHFLPGVVNRDWEDLAQDDKFIYVGDFGNNRGSRQDLLILRVDKAGLKSGKPSIDKIWFSFSDQEDFTSAGLNQTDFDCEAFVVSAEGIYLFTKQWISGKTSQYVLPKLPGRYVAQKRGEFNIQGQVTGATFLPQERLLVLCGYAGLVQPFLTFFYNYEGDDFFSGEQKRVHIALPFHQVEAVASGKGRKYYLTNERTVVEPYVNLPPKLHQLDIDGLLEEIPINH